MKEWTIMVYMAGDNNLSENLAFSLEDIRSVMGSNVGGSDKINVLTFFDSNSLTAPTYYTDYSEGQVEKHEMTIEDLYHHPENFNPPANAPRELITDGNSASACSIMNFVRWCIKTRGRTAENYALVFSGHSFGFHGTSFMRDENSGGFITLFKFRWALEEIIEEYLGKKIGILGFDSCVMSMLEIGYELKEAALTIVASEGSLPNSGWSYAPLLKRMIEKFNQSLDNEENNKNLSSRYFDSGQYVKDAAQIFVTEFIEKHKELVIGGRSIDISAWDLDKVPALAAAVNRLGDEFDRFLYLADKVESGKIENDDIWAFQELKKIILQAHYDTQTYMNEQCIDLKDFCKRMIIELSYIGENPRSKVFENLKVLCKNIIFLVEDCVLKSGFCGDEYQFSNGISLYFPWSYLTFGLTDFRYRYLLYNRGENNFDMANPTGIGKDWRKFLFHYLTRVTMRLARKRKFDETGEEQIPALENITKDNPLWSKDSPIWSKDNSFWARSNPTASRSNPTASRSNPTASRSNPTASRSNPTASRSNPTASRGEMSDYLFYFSRYKNFELRWDVSGFADEFKFDTDSEK